ncbi:hypothetical protein [Actinocorallia longicatena]|uniref:MuF-like minor capsid protein n=1 Tax=Actinocorallia longicatena TaxID=111803 RepID=A0ABP6QK39_9ACTN
MAGTAVLTQQHRTQQLAVRAAMLRDLALLWPTWETGNISEFGQFISLAETLLGARQQESAGLAATYYRAFRRAAGVTGAAEPKLAERLLSVDVSAALRATGLAGTLRALRAGQPPQAAARTGFSLLAGSAIRLTLSGGRATIEASVQADPKARGWARVTSGSPCDFCAMLASRGAVFKSERTAGFEAHDNCACTAQPIFAGTPLPPGNERYARLWEESTAGLSGADARSAFRKALSEGS